MKLGQFQEQFNEQIRGAHLDLVFFHDAMVHLFIISRIINTPRSVPTIIKVKWKDLGLWVFTY